MFISLLLLNDYEDKVVRMALPLADIQYIKEADKPWKAQNCDETVQTLIQMKEGTHSTGRMSYSSPLKYDDVLREVRRMSHESHRTTLAW